MTKAGNKAPKHPCVRIKLSPQDLLELNTLAAVLNTTTELAATYAVHFLIKLMKEQALAQRAEAQQAADSVGLVGPDGLGLEI